MKKETLTIGYFADGPWAHLALEKIKKDSSIKVAFICVRYDKKDPVLIELGKKYQIDVLFSPNINSEEFIEQLKKYNVDLFVSMSFNQIFRKKILSLPPLKTINCHAGKLPFYRGRNILNWVLINDEKEFGITVHYVDIGIDTGDIILQKTYSITDQDDYNTLLERAYVGCAEILYEAIKLIQNDAVCPILQSEIDKIGIYCGIRQEGDELLDWNQDSRDIFNFVRAICPPGPCATSFINNKLVKIKKVAMVEGAHIYKGIPGQVIGTSSNGYYVKTKDTMLELLDFEYDGKIKIGSRFKANYE